MDSITVYADYVCPFCYLGRQSLEAFRADREERIEVEWHPFDLRGQHRDAEGNIDVAEATPDDEYMEQVKGNVERLRERYGADAMLDVTEVPEIDSLEAQAASLHVRNNHPDDWEAFDEALYEAHWEDGVPIDDRDVLAARAESIGLDGGDVVGAIDDTREAVFEAFDEARETGITGVPTFVYGERAARGAVPPEQLERLVG
jgi:predicted DsbA family dithiol-disulfide isomerase